LGPTAKNISALFFPPVVALVVVGLAWTWPCQAFTPQGTSTNWGRRPRIYQHTISLTRLFVSESNATHTDGVVHDDPNEPAVETIRALTEQAIRFRGEPRGMQALNDLEQLCTRRLTFDLRSPHSPMKGSLISHFPGLLPRHVTKNVFERVQVLERQGLLSTNPDSVDGLPSFHLNLVSHGKPVVLLEDDKDELDDFDHCIDDLLQLVGPYIYNELLPKVQQLMNTTSIRVGDIFLRRYGQDVIDGKFRNGIPAHYDVFSRATSVITLDDVGANGRNGLFTTQMSTKDGKTSNHAALRRFFPLARGDGMVYTWDVLHGVDVEPGLDRTSLVVWFTTKDELDSEQSLPPSQWLYSQPDLETNHVGQFVLASAIESSESPTTG